MGMRRQIRILLRQELFSEELAPVVDKDGNAYYIDTEGHKKKVIDFCR